MKKLILLLTLSYSLTAISADACKVFKDVYAEGNEDVDIFPSYAEDVVELSEIGITAYEERRQEILGFIANRYCCWPNKIKLIKELPSERKERLKATLERNGLQSRARPFDPQLSFEENFLNLSDHDNLIRVYIIKDQKEKKTYEFMTHAPGDNQQGYLFDLATGKVVAGMQDLECYPIVEI